MGKGRKYNPQKRREGGNVTHSHAELSCWPRISSLSILTLEEGTLDKISTHLTHHIMSTSTTHFVVGNADLLSDTSRLTNSAGESRCTLAQGERTGSTQNTTGTWLPRLLDLEKSTFWCSVSLFVCQQFCSQSAETGTE